MGEDGASGPPAEEGSCERFRAPAVGGPIEVTGLGLRYESFPRAGGPCLGFGGPLAPSARIPRPGASAGLHIITCSPGVELKAGASGSRTGLS